MIVLCRVRGHVDFQLWSREFAAVSQEDSEAWSWTWRRWRCRVVQQEGCTWVMTTISCVCSLERVQL